MNLSIDQKNIQSMHEKLVDVWESANTLDNYEITEDYLSEGKSPEIDGQIILGKIKGPFFLGDGISRNQRFYPRKVWENQLSKSEIQERLKNRTMLGCIGHADGPVTEGDITEGKVSHIVTSLLLQEDNVGIGEVLILGTPSGKNLYTLMKAGVKLKISSRAQGKFLEGQTHNGMPMVDPDSFILETFDFVINPGFIETDPRLQESLQIVNSKIQENKEKHTMELNEMLNEVKKTNAIYEDRYREQKKLREEAEEEKKEIEKEKEEVEKELKEVKRQLAAYKPLGEAEELARDLREYAEMGINSPTEARFILESLKEEAEEAIAAEDVEELKQDIEESAKLLAQYEELGTPEELADIKAKAEELVDELEKKEIEENIARFSRKYNLPESLIRRICEVTEADEAEEAIENIAKEAKAERDDDDDDDDDDDKDDFRRFSNFSRKRDRLEGMADPKGTDVDNFEDDHNLPNKTNDNTVKAVPDVVDEALEEMLNDSKDSANILESYKPASIVNNMFS